MGEFLRRHVVTMAFVLLAVAAVVVCAVETARAGDVLPVFPWTAPSRELFVTTKRQFDELMVEQRVGRVAAVASLVFLAAAVVSASVRRRRAG